MNVLFEKLCYNYFIENLSLFIAYFIVVMFTFPLESVLLPKLYGKLFEQLKSDKTNLDNIFNVFENVKSFNVPGIMTLVSLSWFMITSAHALKQSLEAKLAPKYLGFIRNIIFSANIEKNNTEFKDVKVGEMITRILDVSRYMKQLGQWLIGKFLPEFVGLLSIVIYSFWIDISIGCILSFGVFMTGLFVYIFGSKVITISSDREKRFYNLTEKLNDSLSNMMNILLNNQNKEESANNKDMNTHHSNIMTDQMDYEKCTILAMQFISVSVYSFALYSSYKIYKNKKISTSLFISTILLLGNYLSFLLTANSHLISHACGNYGNIHASKSFIEDILSESKTKNKKNFITNGNIEFQNLSFKYGKNFIFKDFNIKIQGNKKTAILGSSGSGKTTLMKMLVQIHRPENGSILIDGVNIMTADVEYIRGQITYINQRTQLFNKSVSDNILYGNKEITKEKLVGLINKYDLMSVYSKLQDGINTNSGVNGNNLSLGMQKVTIILRGILKQCKIIIFDEPLAGLDSTTRGKVMKMMQQECKNKTMIVITHDKEILPYMDQIINLNKFKHT
mgnify:FL=1|uniref:ABC transporter domain-containing protein n=1 Tax=viral metagenome TaxID=1070528 RepID=A0A6C0EGP2_9ZZZZ